MDLSHLSPNEIASIFYHNIFDYPLMREELVRWKAAWTVTIKSAISYKNSYYFPEGREGNVSKRLRNERNSKRKIAIAKKAAKVLHKIPTMKMIAITGALCMNNAKEGSDIDFMIITQKGTLWTTRLVSLLLLDLVKIPRRKPKEGNQKDRLCLNMWLDESDLVWDKKNRNIYTAHEIAQIIPIVNKDKVYEKFIWENRWIRNYWPKALEVRNWKPETRRISVLNSILSLAEPIVRWLQYSYMKPKITSEVVTPTRALFHPVDWGELVLKRLNEPISPIVIDF